MLLYVGMQLPSCNYTNYKTGKLMKAGLGTGNSTEYAPRIFPPVSGFCRVFSLLDYGMRIDLRTRKAIQICVQVK